MELADAKLCSDCNRVFDEFRHGGVCPWCTCDHGVKVADYLPPLQDARQAAGGDGHIIDRRKFRKVNDAVGLNLG